MDELSLAVELNEMLADLKPEERSEVFKTVMEGYCKLCGAEEPCYCAPGYDE